jgi:hypothetical protein
MEIDDDSGGGKRQNAAKSNKDAERGVKEQNQQAGVGRGGGTRNGKGEKIDEISDKDLNEFLYDETKWSGDNADKGKEEKMSTKTTVDGKVNIDGSPVAGGNAKKKTDATIAQVEGDIEITDTMDIDATDDEVVQEWEKRIKKINLKMGLVLDDDIKMAELNNQMDEAQLALKDALLRVNQSIEKEAERKGNMECTTMDYEQKVTGKRVERDIEHEEASHLTATGAIENDGGNGQQTNKDHEILPEKTSKRNKNHKSNIEHRLGDRQVLQEEIIRWEDVSDDETVAFTNQTEMSIDNDDTWQIATNRKKKTPKDKGKIKLKENETERQMMNHQDNKSFLGSGNSSLLKAAKSTKEQINTTKAATNIINPYKQKNTKKDNKNNNGEQMVSGEDQTNKASITSYMEAVKGKTRAANAYSIRLTTSFTPRTTGVGEFKRLAKELLNYSIQVASEALLLPWKDNTGNGPIKLEDLNNPMAFQDSIKDYFDKPPYVTLQPGTPAYRIGFRVSVNCDKIEFINKWNILKREFKMAHKPAYTINLAPAQKSDTAFIVGVAVGSNEDQDDELLNKYLEEATGIKGIEVNYQNIRQTGITEDFWKIANRKAKDVSTDNMSRDHLKTKYQWAPNALAIYVPQKEMVQSARNILLKLYGKSENGCDPTWPDGSTMRFYQSKAQQSRIKTKEIVRKEWHTIFGSRHTHW